MSTHNTEGRREIEAIKQRLEAAKVQVSTASNNVASTKVMATKMIENAQSMSDMANREVKEIENTLKRAKDKAKEMKDVLDNVKSMTQSNIDTMESQLETSKRELKDVEKLLTEAKERAKQEAEGSNKRRKISPQTVSSGITVKTEDGNDYDKETDNEEDQDDNNNYAGVFVKKEEESDHVYDDETGKEDEDETIKTNKLPASESNNGMNSATGSTTNNQEVLGSSATSSTTVAIGQSNTEITIDVQVIVEGWGRPGVNGTYTKLVGHTYKGAPVYSKGDYVIYRYSTSMRPNSWYIGRWNVLNGTPDDFLRYSYYGSLDFTDSMSPPTNGWAALQFGFGGPAPKLRLATAINVANACTSSEKG